MVPPAYLFTAPNGVPGDISRVDETNVEPAMLIAVSSTFAQAFGIPMVYATGGIAQYSTGKVAADFAGILVREVPSIAGNTNQGFDDTVPNPKVPNGLAVRGYVNVKCTQGTPARGGIVYVRVIAASGKYIGDLEASSDTTLSVALSSAQASWAVDGKDADNNTEIRIAR